MVIAEVEFLPTSPAYNRTVQSGLSEDLGPMTQSSTNIKWQGFLSCVMALCVHVSFKLLLLSKTLNSCYFEAVALVYL